MSVTTGFLRLASDEFEQLRGDASAFERRCRDYDQPGYLDMDKAGWELLFILDPASVEYDNPDAKTPYPAITDVLGGGEKIHESIDFGCGPAMFIADGSIAGALREIQTLSLDRLSSMALSNELLPDILMCELDDTMIRDYHWPYLTSLAQFLAEAQQSSMVVLRY